jgi:hypothetical protein
MANIQRTPEQWQQILEQHAASGMQITAFCKQQKLNTSSFYAWRKRLTNKTSCHAVSDITLLAENNPDRWVSITPEPSQPSPNWDIELALPNGVVLRMMNH